MEHREVLCVTSIFGVLAAIAMFFPVEWRARMCSELSGILSNDHCMNTAPVVTWSIAISLYTYYIYRVAGLPFIRRDQNLIEVFCLTVIFGFLIGLIIYYPHEWHAKKCSDLSETLSKDNCMITVPMLFFSVVLGCLTYYVCHVYDQPVQRPQQNVAEVDDLDNDPQDEQLDVDQDFDQDDLDFDQDIRENNPHDVRHNNPHNVRQNVHPVIHQDVRQDIHQEALRMSRRRMQEQHEASALAALQKMQEKEKLKREALLGKKLLYVNLGQRLGGPHNDGPSTSGTSEKK